MNDIKAGDISAQLFSDITALATQDDSSEDPATQEVAPEATTADEAPFVRLIPLGGLGEVGMNCMAYQLGADGAILVVDCGITFPDAHTPGIDQIIPDITFLKENREKVVGIVFTHGHEDHIGATPYLWPELRVPVYGTAMTLGILRNKLIEHGLASQVPQFTIQGRDRVQIGPFLVEPMAVTHSISDGVSLAIHTPAGVIIHTGDFKFDNTPVDGRRSDYARLAAYGEEGVLALLSDSTNVERTGASPSEGDITASFLDIFAKAKGMLVVATFSSNIHRVQQVIDAAVATGRKVCLNGRSMIANTEVARELGYLKVPMDTLIDEKEIEYLPRNKVVVLSTGSQGEPRASLRRIALGEHKRVVVGEGDTVVLSSRAIPGNEKAISNLINHLLRRGCEVIHDRVSEVHVSGHGSQEDLKMMLALTRPKLFVPVHGEIRHLVRHRKLAQRMGVLPGNTAIVENGQVLRIYPDRLERDGTVPVGRAFIDGKGVGDVGEEVLRERRILSEDGMLVVLVVIDAQKREIVLGPELFPKGLTDAEDGEGKVLEACKRKVLETFQGLSSEHLADLELVREEIRVAGRRFFRKEFDRRPIVLPLVFEV